MEMSTGIGIKYRSSTEVSRFDTLWAAKFAKDFAMDFGLINLGAKPSLKSDGDAGFIKSMYAYRQ